MQRRGYISLPEAARYCGRCTKTIERWMKKGLPFYRPKCGGNRCVKITDLEEWLVAGSKTPAEEAEIVDDLMRGF